MITNITKVGKLFFAALAAGAATPRVAHLAPQAMAAQTRQTSDEIIRETLKQQGKPVSPELEKLTTTLEWCKTTPYHCYTQWDCSGCDSDDRRRLVEDLSKIVDKPATSDHYD